MFVARREDWEAGGEEGAGLLKKVAHARGAHAHEHLDELAGRNAEEVCARLARHRASQQRLARTGRAAQEYTLGHAAAGAPELLGLAKEINHLPKRSSPQRRP